MVFVGADSRCGWGALTTEGKAAAGVQGNSGRRRVWWRHRGRATWGGEAGPGRGRTAWGHAVQWRRHRQGRTRAMGEAWPAWRQRRQEGEDATEKQVAKGCLRLVCTSPGGGRPTAVGKVTVTDGYGRREERETRLYQVGE